MVAHVGAAPRDAAAAPELSPGPHLFLDDQLLETQCGLVRTVRAPARDLPGPVITGPEDRCFQPYVSVLRDAETGRFRAWYGVPESDIRSRLAYLEGPDGIHWDRPHRVLTVPDPIQFGISVVDDGPRCPEPSRRYKYGWWHDGGLKVAASPDGLEWRMLAPGVVLHHNHDINSIHRDPIRGHYLALVSVYTEGPGYTGPRRIPHQSISRDLVHWETPWPVIVPDARDEGDTQFYCMSGVLARGGLLIGTLKVLRDDLPADPGGPRAGIGYTVLAWSRDGRTWTRDRTPFLDRHPEAGTWDHAMSWIDCQLPVGDQVYLYYGGYARGHKIERFKERQIGLVRMPRDRYVSRDAGEGGGTFWTPLLRPAGSGLALNLEASGGEARVQVLDPEGRPVPGYRYSDCRPVTGDSLAAPVHWRRPWSALRGRPVRLEVTLRRARLYALDVAA